MTDPVDFNIRPARTTDTKAIHALEMSLFEGDRLSRPSIRRLIGSPSAVVAVALADGMVVGAVVMLFRRGSRRARLYSLAVAVEFQNMRLGRRLLAHAHAAALQRGATELVLEVRADNLRARDLYRRCGFTQTGERAGYYQDGENALCLARTVEGGFLLHV